MVQQQKAECSQKLEGLNMWLSDAASFLASQKAAGESADVKLLQERQKKLKVEKPLSLNLYYKAFVFFLYLVQQFYSRYTVTDA